MLSSSFLRVSWHFWRSRVWLKREQDIDVVSDRFGAEVLEGIPEPVYVRIGRVVFHKTMQRLVYTVAQSFCVCLLHRRIRLRGDLVLWTSCTCLNKYHIMVANSWQGLALLHQGGPVGNKDVQCVLSSGWEVQNLF